MALDTYASYNVNIFHLNLSVNRNLNPRVTGILISIHWKFQASIAGLWVKIYPITIIHYEIYDSHTVTHPKTTQNMPILSVKKKLYQKND